MKSSSFSGELPLTGRTEFDSLMYGTSIYAGWISNLAGRGFSIIVNPLPEGTAAWIEKWMITIDPDQFRYIDLLHESRHMRQIEKAWWQGLDPFAVGKSAKILRAWFELGAYEYEQRIGRRYDFSVEYMDFLARQIDLYWKRSYRQELKFSRTTRDYLNRIWR